MEKKKNRQKLMQNFKIVKQNNLINYETLPRI